MSLSDIDYRFVYSISNKGKMIEEFMKSVKSLNKYVPRDKILVYYTPPIDYDNLSELSNYSEVKISKNITDPFIFLSERGLGRYGEKVHLCETKSDVVIFLDCDTIIKKNPLELIKGDYDFSARIGGGYYDFDMDVWDNMFKKIGGSPVPMPNTGFMIFKNSLHRKLFNCWLTLINSDIDNPHPSSNLKEQYALALCLSGYKIKWMSSKEHVFLWNREGKINTYVLHGRPTTIISLFKILLNRARALVYK